MVVPRNALQGGVHYSGKIQVDLRMLALVYGHFALKVALVVILGAWATYIITDFNIKMIWVIWHAGHVLKPALTPAVGPDLLEA